MSGNGWRGRGDPMEEMIERWLTHNGIKFRRGDDMKARLDFFLPDFNVYIECKRFHTKRINDQIERAPDVIVVQGKGSLRFLESLISRGCSSVAERRICNAQDAGSNPAARSNPVAP